jgi:hypothetical protein
LRRRRCGSGYFGTSVDAPMAERLGREPKKGRRFTLVRGTLASVAAVASRHLAALAIKDDVPDYLWIVGQQVGRKLEFLYNGPGAIERLNQFGSFNALRMQHLIERTKILDCEFHCSLCGCARSQKQQARAPLSSCACWIKFATERP